MSASANGSRPKLGECLLAVPTLVLTLVACTACRPESPQTVFEHARSAFIHGNLLISQQEAERGFQRYSRNPEWAWKFKNLEAESMLWRGMYPDVVRLLDTEPSDNVMRIEFLAMRGAALARLHKFSEAKQALDEAHGLCGEPQLAQCGAVSRAQGVLATERRQISDADHYFQQSLLIARGHHDTLLEATALLNLGAAALLDARFDEAVDRATSAYEIAHRLDAQDIEQNALGNLGWAYYRLGDAQRALDLFLQAEKRAVELGDLSDQAAWLTNAGYVQMDMRNLPLAQQSFQRALDLERQVQSKEDVYNALRVLARLYLQSDDTMKASLYAGQALALARDSGSHVDELYPLLIQGQIAASNGLGGDAEKTFEQVEHDQACPIFLRWEAQRSLGQLHEHQGHLVDADREYRTALTTFESARFKVQHEDSQLSFLTNGARLYDDYVHFLVSQNKDAEALQWADFSRARALAEGLGRPGSDPVKSSKNGYVVPPPLDAQSVARRAKGTLLFYWLGEKQSYLWAVTSSKTQLFTLPPGPQIEAAVRRYRQALIGPQNVLESAEEDGVELYRTLIAPAESMIAKNGKAYVLPDGSLNNLNFETLIVGSPSPHFWIEDADVVNASSLRVLDASFMGKPLKNPRLLLIGNSVAVSKDYPELSKAADQMASVARHFPAGSQRVFERDQATPAAYLQNHLDQYSNIHFVAHGIASRLSPLDSAIVLSKDKNNPESFKLYARDIIHHHLRAELVTISACYGAGERQYSGEGLVGLAWAFLRAGSRNVIAALWEVTDASTDRLMDRFYEELSKGVSPDVALRTAKLALLRGSAFHNPFYWAPFQLYRG